MSAPGVILIQSFTYRDAPEEFSNSYHILGSTPADDGVWRDVVNSLADIVKTVMPSRVKIVRALCYENLDGAHDSVYTYRLADWAGEVTCTFADTGPMTPGDAAMWLRFSTGRNTSSGKPIYLRKYYHSPITQDPPDEDKLLATQKTALEGAAADLLAGVGDWPGLSDLDGSTLPGGYLASRFITTRTLKRRGRRPT